MINTYFNAKLVDYYNIKVFIFSNVQRPSNIPIILLKNNDEFSTLSIIKETYINGLCLIECQAKEKIELGNKYRILIENFGITTLDVNDATSFKDFDKDYFYDGDDLGFSYSKEKTIFKLWAPLASHVSLFLKNKSDKFETFLMERGEKGVYSITINGDLDGAKYRFQVENSGNTWITTDPYAKASSANGRDSYVIDFNKTKVNMNSFSLKENNEYVDNIIYELHVRDFTIHPNTNIEHKGKYLGLAEEGRVTKSFNKAGLDYLADLGITHVQFMPIYDYKTVDELDTENTYNWGYDPAQYFVPEGGYSTNPDDAYARILECKEMISKLHKKGIKVNMDVVFNHVYNYQTSVFEKIVPNYYFRKKNNGLLSVASGCGNELDTERPMVRKLIIDCCKYWINEYDIDGYRFDLMGLIDIETMNEIDKLCKSMKTDFMIYGEGWNMDSSLEEDKRSTIQNSNKLPGIAFFNDSFRNIVGGHEGKNNEEGYLQGNTSYKEGFKFVLLGSSIEYCYKPRFVSPNQSINYCECHDNMTLFDKFSSIKENAEESIVLEIIKSINATILFSFGIPFFHSGQEIGRTKLGNPNSYNSGDLVNRFDWDLVDSRRNMFLFMKSLIELRKGFKAVSDINIIEDNNYFVNLDDGAIAIKIDKKVLNSEGDIIFAINPTDNVININFEDYVKVFVSNCGVLKNSELFVKNSALGPHQIGGYFTK